MKQSLKIQHNNVACKIQLESEASPTCYYESRYLLRCTSFQHLTLLLK